MHSLALRAGIGDVAPFWGCRQGDAGEADKCEPTSTIAGAGCWREYRQADAAPLTRGASCAAGAGYDSSGSWIFHLGAGGFNTGGYEQPGVVPQVPQVPMG
jgi:hypothetical protein